MSILTAAVLLFMVMDPIGNAITFLCVLRSINPHRQRKIILREMSIALLILVIFLVSGKYIMQLFNISPPSLSISGGIILFLIAIKMVFSGTESVFNAQFTGEPFIVPLAVPLIAGPSAMAMVMLFMAREPHRWLSWLIALVLAWSVSCIILLLAGVLRKIIGERGLKALECFMGMLLTTAAVQMFINGLQQLFPAKH